MFNPLKPFCLCNKINQPLQRSMLSIAMSTLKRRATLLPLMGMGLADRQDLFPRCHLHHLRKSRWLELLYWWKDMLGQSWCYYPRSGTHRTSPGNGCQEPVYPAGQHSQHGHQQGHPTGIDKSMCPSWIGTLYLCRGRSARSGHQSNTISETASFSKTTASTTASITAIMETESQPVFRWEMNPFLITTYY